LPEWLVRAAYVGSSSLYGRTTKQLNPAVYIPGSTLGTDARRRYAPDIGTIDYYTQDRRANYHSMQLSVTKRLSKGFTILGSYTWSKSMDYFGSFVMPFDAPNGDLSIYGPSDFDHRHRWVTSWVWNLPTASVTNAFLKQVINGWQWSGNGQYQTGSPFNIRSGVDNSRTGLGQDRPKLTGVSTASPAGADKRVWFNTAAFAQNDIGTFGELGRNALYGPHLFSFDMGVFKTFALKETWNLQFRAELFNIFNQVNFNNPNAVVNGGGFGTITSTNSAAGDPRIIQFALKLNF
jgi:hypothetical protein